MPTLAPPPVPTPKTEEERVEREQYLKEMLHFLDRFDRFLYTYRSHIPGGFDFTETTDGLYKIMKIMKERPDWVARCSVHTKHHEYHQFDKSKKDTIAGHISNKIIGNGKSKIRKVIGWFVKNGDIIILAGFGIAIIYLTFLK